MCPSRPIFGAAGASILASCSLLTDTSGFVGGTVEEGDADSSRADSSVADSSIDTAVQCIDTRSDPVNCGRCGHSCLGDPCVEGACQPTALATGQQGAYGIDVDETNVFWSSALAGSVSRIDKNATNGVPVPLIQRSSPFKPLDVRVDGAYVGVINGKSGDGSGAGYRVNKAGGSAIALGPSCTIDGVNGLAFDATHAFFVNSIAGDVYRVLKTSGAECAAILSGQSTPLQIVVDDTSLFFTNGVSSPSTGGLMTMPKQGGAATAIAKSSIPAASGIAIDGATLFVSLPDGRIVSVNKDGTGLVELANGQPSPYGIAVDDRSVYWADVASGEVWAADKSLGKPRLIAANQPQVTMVAVDRDRIYWATEVSVMRVAK